MSLEKVTLYAPIVFTYDDDFETSITGVFRTKEDAIKAVGDNEYEMIKKTVSISKETKRIGVIALLSIVNEVDDSTMFDADKCKMKKEMTRFLNEAFEDYQSWRKTCSTSDEDYTSDGWSEGDESEGDEPKNQKKYEPKAKKQKKDDSFARSEWEDNISIIDGEFTIC